ncbi:MAG: helix-turn-helix domain-containing protein [Candidatus Micrarchaeota archaeon]
METQKSLDGFVAAAAQPVQLARTPSISPFKGATLLVLRFLYINNSGYASQIAKHCGVTAARACQVLKDLEGKALVESTSRETDCRYCAGTGRKNYGTQSASCIYCENGRTKEKTYPLFYRITDSSRPAVAGMFNAIYEISAGVQPKA